MATRDLGIYTTLVMYESSPAPHSRTALRNNYFPVATKLRKQQVTTKVRVSPSESINWLAPKAYVQLPKKIDPHHVPGVNNSKRKVYAYTPPAHIGVGEACITYPIQYSTSPQAKVPMTSFIS